MCVKEHGPQRKIRWGWGGRTLALVIHIHVIFRHRLGLIVVF
jgi:hypothetical protein